MKFRFIALVFVLFVSAGTAVAQPGAKAPDNWFNLDAAKDGVQGTGANEALKKLQAKGRKPQTIIVAILDSGVDYVHEDLKDIMWVNPGEIPGNGIDDDGNGYIDDIHGWNFIGGKDGRNVDHDTYELTREYVRLSKRFKGTDPKNLHGEAKKEYAYFEKIKEAYETKRGELEQQKAQFEAQFSQVEGAFSKVQKALGKDDFTGDDLKRLKSGELTEELEGAINMVEMLMTQGMTPQSLAEQKEGAGKYFNSGLNYGYNPDFDPRSIVGDNYDDLTNRFYGNNIYDGPDAFHGTHVAGIVAAIRNNNIGIDGVAPNVRIMTVRCVPDGDERDKDVANAIRYAVDNGASIINMSFGKGYSPQKAYVDEAVKYAAQHDVLLVHAAGNDSENNDTDPNFPNAQYLTPVKKGLFKKEKSAPNWLEVGALSWRKGERAVAGFSNYGKKNVHLFSPGVAIYSTIPGSKYGNAQGTSMAAPAAAGVAAIIRSHYPELSADQVRDLLVNSAEKLDIEVIKPGTTTKVKFSELSVSGGVVSAPRAVDMAETLKPKKNKKAIWREAGMGKKDAKIKPGASPRA